MRGKIQYNKAKSSSATETYFIQNAAKTLYSQKISIRIPPPIQDRILSCASIYEVSKEVGVAFTELSTNLQQSDLTLFDRNKIKNFNFQYYQ